MATYSGFKAERYAGAADNRDHTLGAATSAGDMILVAVWRSNATTTGAQNHATSAGFTEVGHHDPAVAWRMIGTVLRKTAVGGETTINFDWAALDGESNQVICSVVVSGADASSTVASFADANTTEWTYPGDAALANSLHTGCSQKAVDVSVSMYPTGDTSITHSAIDWRNGGISVSGGATASQTHSESINGAVATISFDDSNPNLVTDVSTVAEDERVEPNSVLGVVNVDVTAGTANFKLAQFSLNNITDDTTWDGAAWVARPPNGTQVSATVDAATPTTTSFDYSAAELAEDCTFELHTRASDTADMFGSWSTRTFVTGVWEYGPAITFTTVADEPVAALVNPSDGQQYQSPLSPVDTIDVVATSDNTVLLEGRVPEIFAGWHDFTGQMDGNGDIDTAWTLSGLDTPGSYTFELRATSSGGGQVTDIHPFTVLAEPDTTPPVAVITAPTADQVFPIGTTSVEAAGTATDDTAVASIEGRLNGGSWTPGIGAETWTWTAGGLVDGQTYTVEIRAYDLAGNISAVVSRTFSVDADVNDPTVVITAPTADLVAGTTSTVVAGTAADDTAVDLVQVREDAGAWNAATGTGSWTYSLTGLTDGSSTLVEARSRDTSGNYSTIASRTVTVLLPEGVEVLDDVVTADVGEPILFDLGDNDSGVGAATYTTQGVLPAGLTLSLGGVLSGTVDTEVSGVFTVDVVSGVDATPFTSLLTITVSETEFVFEPVVSPAFPGASGTDADRIGRAQAQIRDWEATYAVTAAAQAAARDAEA